MVKITDDKDAEQKKMLEEIIDCVNEVFPEEPVKSVRNFYVQIGDSIRYVPSFDILYVATKESFDDAYLLASLFEERRYSKEVNLIRSFSKF